MSVGSSWRQRPEGGGAFAIGLILAIARWGGRSVSRLLLYPITLYFLIIRGPERRASRAYLTRVLRRPATLMEVAKHIHCFAATILDRVFMLSGRFDEFELQIKGLEDLHAQMDEGRGVLLFGSHHGSFEVLRVLSLRRPDVKVRVVMDRGQNASITRMLDTLCPEIAATVIDARQEGSNIALEILNAINDGALVTLLVDRSREEATGQPVRFMDADACFPTAPFLLAAALKVPVVLCFGLYRGGRRYDLHFESFAESLAIPRKDRAEGLRLLQQRYADRLQHYVTLAPYNWFNFYDFWTVSAPATKQGSG